ncbi:uncharacterized protein [Centruroides vittatus]|uniref:uncharacterized protein n=1 Tax=Centruroides vittatus TaxID=120091 RepID=UPI003510B4E8
MKFFFVLLLVMLCYAGLTECEEGSESENGEGGEEKEGGEEGGEEEGEEEGGGEEGGDEEGGEEDESCFMNGIKQMTESAVELASSTCFFPIPELPINEGMKKVAGNMVDLGACVGLKLVNSEMLDRVEKFVPTSSKK